ncbi:TIGR01777 family oxidoreductase [Mucisphaera sp.]|uniref:TIGR01777 family oxidoreductase n=1 Tax=Mucisphaera sp. TaxID=2913024 RepID=UPI003D0B6377
MPVSAEELYAWHARPGAFERLTPPWQRVEVLRRSGGIEDGARIDLRIYQGPIPTIWKIEHRNHVSGEQFEDHLLEGPFPVFRHRHRFESLGGGRSRLIDSIAFEMPGGRVTELVAGRWLLGQMRRAFAWRHAVTRADLAAHAEAACGPMRVAVSGASGLIGGRLSAFLTTGGHEVVPMIRHGGSGVSERRTDRIRWSWPKYQIDAGAMEGLDGVVHLAAEPIMGSWTPNKKRLIRESRVRGTRLVAEAVSRLRRKPKVLVVASAIGIYGDRGQTFLDEGSPVGDGFLAEVAEAWEAAAEPARAAGIRVVNARIGIVVTPTGGALAKMLPAFWMGAGGRLGHGNQWWGWIGLDDVVGVLHRALVDERMAGAVNLVSPGIVTNRGFTAALGKAIRRPTWFPVPRGLLRLAMGRQMANEVLLSSQRVRPEVLGELKYGYRHPDLRPMLAQQLGMEDAV